MIKHRLGARIASGLVAAVVMCIGSGAVASAHENKKPEPSAKRSDGSAKSLGAASVPASGQLPTPTAGQPQTVNWTGSLTFTTNLVSEPPNDGTHACLAPECDEIGLEVAPGAKTLYLKASWQRADYYLYLYAFAPDGTQHGVDFSETSNSYDKRVGNNTTLPLAETTIANPAPGTWRVRVRAAWGLNVAYQGVATVTAEAPIEWKREDVLSLSRWATHKVPVNIVFAGITPTPQELAAMKEQLPDKYHPSVLAKILPSGSDEDDSGDPMNSCDSGNWSRCHYGGTYSEERREEGQEVPHFEPIKFEYEYHFIQADERYTRAAFAKMKEFTKVDAVPQGVATLAYTANGGTFRTPIVTPEKRVDLIDAVKFEDWLFASRYGFCDNFTDLDSGKVHGGGFISPDNNAYYDPYYDKNGRNVDKMPQGRNEGVTIFYFDTYSPSFAGEYFDMSKYHRWVTTFTDPDTQSVTNLNYMRSWGGRYRFWFQDLGAAPNGQESSTLVGVGGSSADYPRGDPPIWQYRNDPRWQPKFVSQGLVRNVVTMLTSRMTASYLYRPIPHDIYQLATTNFLDYYATEASGYGTSTPDLTTLYNEKLAARWLSAAIPHTTFRTGEELTGFKTYRYLTCSDTHVGSKNTIISEGTPVKSVNIIPDPTCIGKTPDPLQQKVEEAKAQGDDVIGNGVPMSQGVSAAIIRNYWEANREQYAPLGDGVFSFVLINAYFEKGYAWYIPLIVAGVSFPTPNQEAWGNFQSVNELVGGGFTYTVEHEASHSLGLLHPHDSVGVEKDASGEWNYYYYTYSWLPDMTQSPTTYVGVIYPYGVWDQDNLMRGHSAEYIQMAQDAIADAYLEAGRSGVASLQASHPVIARRDLMNWYLSKGRDLFAAGDYLHAEYAFRNAYLAASGHRGPEITPRELRAGEKIFFKVDRQPGLTRSASYDFCLAGGARPLLAVTGSSAAATAAGMILLMVAVLLARWLRRPAVTH